jgi:hypothetical protein
MSIQIISTVLVSAASYDLTDMATAKDEQSMKNAKTRASSIQPESQKSVPRHGSNVIHHTCWAGGRHVWANRFRQIFDPG